MWILRIIWNDGSETIRAYATKKIAEEAFSVYYNAGADMIAIYDIYKRSDVYYE